MDIINKSYKRRDSVNSDIFTVDSIEGDFVIFKNGARCKMSTLLSDFEETIGNPIVTESLIIDPDTFFNSTISENDPLLQQMELVATNPNAQLPVSDKLQQSVSLDNKYEKVVPGGSQAPASGLANRLMQNDDAHTPHVMNEGVQEANQPPRLPEWDVFDRVKKSEEIEILVPFKIKLPRAEKIDALNDMFETSFTMYLAKQYIKNNVANNSIALQKTIQDAIEEWIESEIYGDKKKRSKPKPSKTKMVKNEKVVEDPVEVKQQVEEVVKPVETGASAADLFGSKQPAWDGDIKKLFIINTDEQYQAVKKRYEHLLNNNPDHDDRYRFEDMLSIYEEQIKEVQNGTNN